MAALPAAAAIQISEHSLRLCFLVLKQGHEVPCRDDLIHVPPLEAEQLAITLAALDTLHRILGDWLEHDSVLIAEENASLRLEVLDAEVRHEDVLRQLLLQLLLDLLAEAHVHLRVVRVEPREDDDLEAPDDPLLCQLERLRDAAYLVVGQAQLVEVAHVDVLLPLAILEYLFDRTEEVTFVFPDERDLDQVHAGLELVAGLFDRELDAAFICDVVRVDDLQQG